MFRHVMPDGVGFAKNSKSWRGMWELLYKHQYQMIIEAD